MASYLRQPLSDWSAVLFSMEKPQVGLLSLRQVKRYYMSIVMFSKCHNTLVFSRHSSVSFNKGMLPSIWNCNEVEMRENVAILIFFNVI